MSSSSPSSSSYHWHNHYIADKTKTKTKTVTYCTTSPISKHDLQQSSEILSSSSSSPYIHQNSQREPDPTTRIGVSTTTTVINDASTLTKSILKTFPKPANHHVRNTILPRNFPIDKIQHAPTRPRLPSAK